MEEFAQGGRLSPKKVKEFIPSGTLGIGEDKNVWIRKARNDGATYWDEFLETWNYSRFIPKEYDLTLGIHFRAEPKADEKYGFDLKYGYYQAGGGFILDVYYADTQLTYAKHETFDAQQFRDDCIYVRDNIMPNDPLLKYEFSEIVGKLTSAFERGELRKDFTEETPEPTPEPREPLEPKFKVGDYVRVVNHLQQVMKAYPKQKEYKFEYPSADSDIQNSAEGYVVGVYFEPDYKENRVVVKKYQDDHKILDEFIIAEEGLEKLISAPEIGDKVYIENSNWIYPASYHEKALLGFKNPEDMTKAGNFSYETATIFAVGQHPFNLMPWYGVIIASNEEALIGIQGIEITERSTPETPATPTEEIPAQEIEFTCKVDASKIDSAYVGAFYSKNKERINKLNSEFSCKILEALVYLSDYEKCGGGVELPTRELEEEDDLLGAIRNLKN